MTRKAERISVLKEDITRLEVDALVNAANRSLRGGGGVDGAIHRAAGPELLEECVNIGECATGDAVLTKGYGLKARYVIHTVGPVYVDGTLGEPELLQACYVSSLELAARNQFAQIAFPCISTGVYRYPKDEACAIAFDSVAQWLVGNELPERVIFCCYEDEDFELYTARLADWL